MPMQVLVLPHDPAWIEMFQVESQRVLAVLGENAIRAYHIGSTAIPTIVAKPIIDLLVVVVNIESVDQHNAAMSELGYEAMGEFGIPLRRYFRKENELKIRTHHIHVFPSGSGQVERHLAFRDFMNAHPDWARQYSDLKKELVAKYPNSIELYVEGKDSFIKHVDQLAAEWKLRSTSDPAID